jgi:pyruvate kinase
MPSEHRTNKTKRSLKQFVAMLQLSDAIKAKAICTLTNSGYTAFQISA